MWTVDSLQAHHLNKVIITLDDDTFSKVILRPKAWPNFRCQHIELMGRLRRLERWKIIKEDRLTNRGAFLIAQSVIKYGFGQSYVAAGAPRWLMDLFVNEETVSSL